jgi:hypothetical protein
MAVSEAPDGVKVLAIGFAPGGRAVGPSKISVISSRVLSKSSEAEARKAIRALAEVRIFRQDEREAEADADARYWDRIPVDERAEFVWRLSLELHELSNPTQRYEPRLSRSVARVLGR